MKPPFSIPLVLIPAILAVSPTVSGVPAGIVTSERLSGSAVSTGVDTRTLPMTARPIEDICSTPDPLWDLSDNWEESPYSASYILYGDTLLSETVDGQRRWYAMRRDSVLLVREESLLHRSVPGNPPPTNAIHAGQPPVTSAAHPYTASGTDSRDFNVRREGTYGSIPAVRGRLVTAPGDTLDVFMTVEETVFLEDWTESGTEAATTVPKDPTFTHSFRRYRWFPASGGPLPVAIQTEESATVDGETATVRYAHVIDPSESGSMKTRGKDDPVEPDVERILSEAVIECSGGEITITTGSTATAAIRVSVASEGGMAFHSGEATLSADTPVRIPCGSFHPGRYIVAVTCGAHMEKRVVTVR